MATIKQKSNDDWRSKRSQEQIAHGALPLNAAWRLRHLTEGRKMFTSFLGASELGLIGSIGLRPIAQVLGSSAYQIGWQVQPYFGSMELVAMTEAHNQVRRLAVGRLRQEAAEMGAKAVVGIRLTEQAGIGGQSLLEISASGTAVTWQDNAPPAPPMLCCVSGQELWAMRQSGYWPVGLALGSCVYYQMASMNTTWATGSGGLLNFSAMMNQELTDYTGGFTEARETALERLADDASMLRAEGVIGTLIDKSIHEHEVEIDNGTQKYQRRDLIIHFSALGTAIAPFTERKPSIFPVQSLGA